MSRAAASYWFEGGRIPPAEELGKQAAPVL
jgi:hypothetical protein